jgi:hypothetical protein
MSLVWTRWWNVSLGGAAPGGHVTAVNNPALALFVANAQGEVFGIRRANAAAGTWNLWTSMSQGSTTPGAPVAAAPWQEEFALYLSDPNGGIYSNAGDPVNGAEEWQYVSGLKAKPGAPVTAVNWKNSIAIFTTDSTGGVWCAYGDPVPIPPPWKSVSQGQTLPGAELTAYTQDPSSVTLFLTDPNGGIYYCSGAPDVGWGLWRQVPGLLIKPGSPVTVDFLGPEVSEVSIHVIDSHGNVQTALGNIAGLSWQPWSSLASSDAFFVPGSKVSTVGSALFAADSEGEIWSFYNSTWGSLPSEKTTPGAELAVFFEGSTTLSLFTTNTNGQVITTTASGFEG